MRVIYNGVDLMVLETYGFDCESVYDETGTDYLYTKVTITVRALVNGLAEVVQGFSPNGPFMSYDFVKPIGTGGGGGGPTVSPPPRPTPNNPVGNAAVGDIPKGTGLDAQNPSRLRGIRIIPNPPGLTHQVVRHRLCTPRRKLYIFSGPGMEQGAPQPGTADPPMGNILLAERAAAQQQAAIRKTKKNRIVADPGIFLGVVFPPEGGGVGSQAVNAPIGSGQGEVGITIGGQTIFQGQNGLFAFTKGKAAAEQDLVAQAMLGAGAAVAAGAAAVVGAPIFLESPINITDRSVGAKATVTDCKNGPTPKMWGVHTALGDANTLMVDWSCETYINEAELNQIQPTGALLSNRFSQIHVVDSDGYTTVTTKGTAIFRTDWVYALPESPDFKRPIIFMPIPLGFVRSNIQVSGREDVTGIDYVYDDVQVPVNFPAGIHIHASSISAVHRQAITTNADVIGGTLSVVERTLGLMANKNFAKKPDEGPLKVELVRPGPKGGGGRPRPRGRPAPVPP